jgi:L-asparaginase II
MVVTVTQGPYGSFMQISATRGPVVESVHHVDAVVADVDGARLVWGDGGRPVIARSALKFLQALPLLRTGAGDRFGVSDDELALACSSHSAEPAHVEAARGWLARIGLDEGALECGPDLPIDDAARIAHLRSGGGPLPVLNGCSGKHIGFLTVARHLGLDHEGYIEPDHPVQAQVTEAIAEFCRHDLGDQRPGRDGCGIPTWAIPLDRLAASMARLVASDGLIGASAAAAGRLVDTIPSRSWWVSGTGRHEVAVVALAAEPLLIKSGAEGVFLAGLPHRGFGVAVKAADGAGRAAQIGVSTVLAHLGVLTPDAARRPVRNKAGVVVGELFADRTDPVAAG